MQLEVGQVYRHRQTGRYVVVLDVRDEKHPGGLGVGYGDSASAWPIDPRRAGIPLEDFHPFDLVILCDRLPSHGDTVWQLEPRYRYDLDDVTLVVRRREQP